MTKNAVVSLTLQIKGNADQKIKQMADAQVKAVKQINTEAQKLRPIQEAQVQTAKKILTELQKQGTALVQQSKDAKAVELTRKLGLRTEQQIKSEIQQTQSIYQKLGILQRQGVVTAKDMERSYAAMKAKVAALNAELGNTVQKEKQIQQVQRQGVGMGQRFQGAVAVGGAMAAGGMVLSNALQKPRDYQQQMTYIMATATGGQGLSTQDRIAQGNNLHQYVKDAVRSGGGTREDAAAALNELIASGKYNVNNVAPALTASTKTAFAAGAEATDAARMTIAMQNFGVRDISLGQDRAMRAGQVGSFEYRDMAKFLPEQMAMAKASGYSGDEGLVKLLALNQMAKTTSADSNQAGNNVVNLLQKLSSREFSDSIAKAVTDTKGLVTKPVVNKKGKVVGQEFDWSTYSIQQRGQGVYGVEAFVKLLERQLAGNKQYTKLQAQAKNAGSDSERKALLDDMSNIAMGSEMGQIIADRQALMAAMAAVYNKGTASKLESQISGAKGTVNADLEMIKTQEWAKDQAYEQEKLFAQSKAYDAISDSLGGLKDQVTSAARGNEVLAASAYAAATALTAVAAASAVGTVLGGGKGGKLGKIAGGLATRAGGAALAAGGPALAVAGAGAAGYAAGSFIYDKAIEGTSFGDKLGETIAKTLAVFGNDDAKAAVEAQRSYEAMLAEQARNNQLSAELNSKLGTLISVTRENKPIPFNLSSGSLAESFGRSPASTQENRHGAPVPFMLQHTGR
jgi:hypothetical protein